MKKFECGDMVRLSKEGRKYVKRLYKGDISEVPNEFPLNGELGCVSIHFDEDDMYTPGLVYVEWTDYADYLKPEYIVIGSESDFPCKLKAYEVRIGDVVEDFEGEKTRVHHVVEVDDGTGGLRFDGRTIDDGVLTFIYKEPNSKVKVFSREYK